MIIDNNEFTNVQENKPKIDNIAYNGNEIEVLKHQNLTISSINVNRRSLPKYWERDYINEHISMVKNYRHRMFLQFLWMTGVRVTEAISVKKRDIDFQNFLITIKWQKNRKFEERNIPMYPILRELLMMYTATMKADDVIFSFTRQGAWKIVKKTFQGHPHQFRHSFAVNWLKSGGELVLLSRMLGHGKIQSTMEYLRIVPIDVGKELLKIKF